MIIIFVFGEVFLMLIGVFFDMRYNGVVFLMYFFLVFLNSEKYFFFDILEFFLMLVLKKFGFLGL